MHVCASEMRTRGAGMRARSAKEEMMAVPSACRDVHAAIRANTQQERSMQAKPKVNRKSATAGWLCMAHVGMSMPRARGEMGTQHACKEAKEETGSAVAHVGKHATCTEAGWA